MGVIQSVTVTSVIDTPSAASVHPPLSPVP